jgi:hypothetical protein
LGPRQIIKEVRENIHHNKFHSSKSSPDIDGINLMSWTRENGNALKILVEKSAGKRPFDR